MAERTPFHQPCEKTSDEADRRQLELAERQGTAAGDAVRYMAFEVAHDGAEQLAGEYVVACAVEEAEGLYFIRDGKLEWVEPENENLHVEIAVRDGADGRIVPGLKVFVTLISPRKEEIGTHEHPLLWHPCVYHYGRNWTVPMEGPYTILVHIEPPQFPRHDKRNGLRFAAPVDVTFTGIRVETGHKISS